jgi:uncharacterized protein YukE
VSKRIAIKDYIKHASYASTIRLPTTSSIYSSRILYIYLNLQHSLSTSGTSMSDRGPSIHSRTSSALMNSNRLLNPTASSFSYAFKPLIDMTTQVSSPPSTYLEARVLNLEEEHSSVRGDVDLLKEMHQALSLSISRLQKGGWPVTVGPFQEQDLAQSHQSALRFKQELEQLSREVHKSVDDVADVEKADSTPPPHLRAANGGTKTSSGSKSLPPHLRNKAPSR